MINGAWRVDQADKDHEQFFPQPQVSDSMDPDRRFEDCYGPDLEFNVNDRSYELNSLTRPQNRQLVQSHESVRVLSIDCKLKC